MEVDTVNHQKTLTGQLGRIEKKLEHLRRADRSFSVFGASSHRYVLNRELSDQQISAFEIKYRVDLPPDYRSFIRFIGDGGPGPYYGLGRLENGRFADMDKRNNDHVIDLSSPFLFSEKWNLTSGDFSSDTDFEDEYFKTTHINGCLRLCNFGCGVSINLVVNGAEYGNMWTDDRISDHGIYPSTELGNAAKISFLDWYELWLDQSFSKFK